MAEVPNPGFRLVLKPDKREEILERIVSDWMSAPTLCLHVADAQARWHLASDTCSQLLDALVEERILERRADGQYSLVRGR